MQGSENSYAVISKKWLILWLFLILACKIVRSTPLPTELPPPPAELTPVEAAAAQAAPVDATTPIPTETPTPTPVPPPTATPYLLQTFSNFDHATETLDESRKYARHGVLIAFLLPLVVFGIPWLIFEFITIRYVQPRGIDFSTLRIKAQDGLFIETTLSMTARRSLSIASLRMTWPRVTDFVEKAVEQELVHQAINFPSLEELEQNLKAIADSFLELPLIGELYRDFGVEVLRFNIETRYPQETMDALNRKAEASAGGAAYVAYATAAHLDYESDESRQLYKVFQETSGLVDAARNIGLGISNLAYALKREEKENNDPDE
ncbi:MAG: hypothetical protein JW953_15605 [Anaerolineae bacterium]|nr:hypothetical protein [Anaerolineae bacterium]